MSTFVFKDFRSIIFTKITVVTVRSYCVCGLCEYHCVNSPLSRYFFPQVLLLNDDVIKTESLAKLSRISYERGKRESIYHVISRKRQDRNRIDLPEDQNPRSHEQRTLLCLPSKLFQVVMQKLR